MTARGRIFLTKGFLFNIAKWLYPKYIAGEREEREECRDFSENMRLRGSSNGNCLPGPSKNYKEPEKN